MTAYLIAAAVMLGLPILGLWPVKITGSKNQNSGWFIRMRRPRDQYQPHDAIFAQEVVEWWLRWAIAFLVALPVALSTDREAIQLFALLLGTLLSIPLVKQIELIGHAAELAYARKHHGAGPEYIATEARSMIEGYDCFRDMSQAEVIAAMERRMPIAKALIALLWLRIRWERQGNAWS